MSSIRPTLRIGSKGGILALVAGVLLLSSVIALLLFGSTLFGKDRDAGELLYVKFDQQTFSNPSVGNDSVNGGGWKLSVHLPSANTFEIDRLGLLLTTPSGKLTWDWRVSQRTSADVTPSLGLEARAYLAERGNSVAYDPSPFEPGTSPRNVSEGVDLTEAHLYTIANSPALLVDLGGDGMINEADYIIIFSSDNGDAVPEVAHGDTFWLSLYNPAFSDGSVILTTLKLEGTPGHD